MSDTWSDIRAAKSSGVSSLREKLKRRKKEREGILETDVSSSGETTTNTGSTAARSGSGLEVPDKKVSRSRSVSPAPAVNVEEKKPEPTVIDPEVESQLLFCLSEITLNLPCDSCSLLNQVSKETDKYVSQGIIEELLQKFAAQGLISVAKENGKFIVNIAHHNKLSAMTNQLEHRKRKRVEESSTGDDSDSNPPKKEKSLDLGSIESLLSSQSAKEKENKKLSEEIQQLLGTPTVKEQLLVEKFKSVGGVQVKEFCQYGTREECRKIGQKSAPCDKLHFRKIIHKHTDETLGDCSFLNTCFHMDTCKYVHYEIESSEAGSIPQQILIKKSDSNLDSKTTLFPPQWVQCDLRNFDMSVLGHCSVVMADPPWDIHMELPYGTMSDDEMRNLDVPSLQSDGYIFLWVTGRAMELGRECLELWGYNRIDELIWVKTNQLQRIIRTGRTGHWLNHGKEHCLVGVKGNPQGINRGLDADVIVAEVRATSHKPDEVYGIIERLAPGSKKVELFGRPHNVQPNWITLGNQVDGVRILDPEIVQRFKKRYPTGSALPQPTST